ncbi:sodium/calcium exchanger 2a isoform X2 [Ictalurus punctatus]|uniref:Sodium/calcium exchanger 2a isoform X2 n=1 Tax=Ictalurus punctatus TaxID=7998 RepID=A0A9F7QZ22_ICTPU|nr:sodium/calcium exchanger 2a isoform X2 [Ictalurus punctatus]
MASPVLLLLLVMPVCACGSVEVNTSSKRSCMDKVVCADGILLPVWLPHDPPLLQQVIRAIIYFASLLYMFLGVSIIADRFMASIEVITSQEKEVTITGPNGEQTVTRVRIWNETISNLTLMALGSSAPEILLSVIEVCGHGFESGELGPGTIVGSAAFNMLVIIAICVSVIPDGEVRKIKHLRVFFITASWSIFAYIWLYLIISVMSPGIVQVWEALTTLLFFPVCVLMAWIADRRLLFYKYLHRRYRADKRHGIIVETDGDLAPNGIDVIMEGKFHGNANGGTSNSTETGKGPEQDREEVIRVLRDLRQRHPDKDLDQLIEMANYSNLQKQPKSRAFYRVQATRMIIGAGNVLKKHAAAEQAKRTGPNAGPDDDLETCAHVAFEQDRYRCGENCGQLSVWVVLRGGSGSGTFQVDYRTDNGSAKAGVDYDYCEGTLEFQPGDTRKEIKIGIIDDDVFEEDEHFFIRLSNLREQGAEATEAARLVEPLVATVTILDDDHAGVFSFGRRELLVAECAGVAEVTVTRETGTRGTVVIPFHTEDGTARGGVDFQHTQGELEFSNEESCKILQVPIINVQEYDKRENFYIVLEEPQWLKRGISGAPSAEQEEAKKTAERGRPVLGEHSRLEVIIEESMAFKIRQGMAPNGTLDPVEKAPPPCMRRVHGLNTVERLLKDTNLAEVIGTHSWKEQFIEAVTVSAGEGDESEGGEPRQPSRCDYFMHVMTVFWKLVFAFVPPSGYWNGWACFIVSIIVIGFLTAVIGDLASHFGCTVGLRDTVTALVFVALGTSIPDTFASKVAAVQDQYADASVGNVTGSNAVNVFLGIGVAWSISAIYWEVKGQVFYVEPGSLAFSVTLFTICAFINMGVLMLRRRPSVGGELGGPKVLKILTSMLFIGLWLLYITFSSLEAYCHIPGF